MIRGAGLLASLALLTGAWLVPSAYAVEPTCYGEAATVVGTPGDDVLHGTKNADVIAGLGGNDEIHAKKSGIQPDFVCGDDGDDLLYGGGGQDLFDGGDGNDSMIGGEGVAQFLPGLGDDYIQANANPDTVGRVVFAVAPGPVTVDLRLKNAGFGTATGEGSDILQGIDWIDGGPFDDVIIGNSRPNGITGGEGDDLIRSRGGDDSIRGRGGNDTIKGGTGDDTIDGDDNVVDQDGNDELYGGAGFDRLNGYAGTDLCVAGEQVENCES